ncbi:putative sulfate exporter family transporter [Azoarcus indigens]|uniref:Putative integral membrane protein (TIGR00698 family) n=1 Tax=Azoarcus indigens TaxID=29545 RepID=A0A4R6DJX7_9RHOO|nr:putative sulfate exporter family transporter [Azoarcus indigens]NMG66943.1 putative sulfate exporter family transporter [Azoarcus indigens]TDN45010.1 putative integral membrane protein (TIGR00698 family) [Azoarcus indigens]
MEISAPGPGVGLRFGLAGCLLITLAAAALAAVPAFARHGLGWLPLAVALGMVAGNLWPRLPAGGAAGIALARGPLMRAGIALYGLRIGADDLALVGWSGVAMAALMVASTLGLAQVLGRRLGLDRDSALLVGCGSAICGAAAVAAADGVLGARARAVSAAVAAVVVFGTLGMYLLPLLHPLLAGLLGLGDAAFGLWLGLTVHELGHVVAAAAAVGPGAEASALIEKMMRVMLLAPAMVWLALRCGRPQAEQATAAAKAARRPGLPLFLWAFIAAIVLAVSGALPQAVMNWGGVLAQLLLAVGLAGLGAATRLADIRQAGGRVWLLAALLWAWLLAAGLFMVVIAGWLA